MSTDTDRYRTFRHKAEQSLRRERAKRLAGEWLAGFLIFAILFAVMFL